MGVQVPQGLRGIWGGVHEGMVIQLTEGVGSCFLGLDATSSPAFSIQPLGDILEVPLVVGGQVPLISVLFIGTPNIAGVVKSEPCGLLVPHRLPAKQGNICLLHPLGRLVGPVAHDGRLWGWSRHSGVQGPFIHSAESSVPIRASGQHREEITSLRVSYREVV